MDSASAYSKARARESLLGSGRSRQFGFSREHEERTWQQSAAWVLLNRLLKERMRCRSKARLTTAIYSATLSRKAGLLRFIEEEGRFEPDLECLFPGARELPN